MTSINCPIAVSLACATIMLGAAPAAAKRGGSSMMVEAGPIWNQPDADMKCAKVARKAGGSWTGQWKTIKIGKMSVCEVRFGRGGGGQVIEVGPIWNQQDAEAKCAKAARKAGKRWTGEWWTTRPGKMSVCEMKGGSASPPRTGDRTPVRRRVEAGPVEVGPIWNQIDAENKCAKAAREAGLRWTGKWWTTQPGRMSVCELGR